jgi:hypothetical protein
MAQDLGVSDLVGLSSIVTKFTVVSVAASSRSMRSGILITILEDSKRFIQGNPKRNVFSKILIQHF